MSRTPTSAMCSVRGMGVAVSVSTSTSRRSCFRRSLCATPKRCSSSMTTRPRFLNSTSRCTRRCVPMQMSTLPLASPAMISRCSLSVRKRESISTLTGKRAQALAEGVEVLLRQDGRRHQHGHLAAVLDRLEGGAQGDLGLAEADVADQQAVHRPRRLHVGLDVVDGLQLVGRLFVREAAFELELPGRVGGIGVPFERCARAVQLHQLLGQVAHRAAHLGLGAHPLAAAEAGQRRVGIAGADVAADAVGLRHRDVQVVAVGVVQQQELGVAGQLERRFLAGRGADRGAHQAAVAGDAVVDVDHQVARLQVGDERLARGRGALRDRRAASAPSGAAWSSRRSRCR